MRRRTWIVAAVAAVAGSYLALRDDAAQRTDRALARSLRRPRGRGIDVAIGATTDAGSMYAVAGASLVLAATGRRRHAVDVALAGAGGWGAAQVLKRVVDRPRPYEDDGAERLVSRPAGSSWPSGHPAVVASVAAALAPSLTPSGRAVATGAVAFVAISRVYVGVHYPTDVVAGAGLGALTGTTIAALRAL